MSSRVSRDASETLLMLLMLLYYLSALHSTTQALVAAGWGSTLLTCTPHATHPTLPAIYP